MLGFRGVFCFRKIHLVHFIGKILIKDFFNTLSIRLIDDIQFIIEKIK